MEDKGLIWEVYQLKIRGFSVPYHIIIKKKCFKKSFGKYTKIIRKSLDLCFNPDKAEEYKSSKRELESIEIHEMNGVILRSKFKWVEEGEKTQNILWI